MDTHQGSSRFGSLDGLTLRNHSSSSSQFFSANDQSPFFSPRSSMCQSSTRSDLQCENSIKSILDSENVANFRMPSSGISSIPAASTSSDFQKFDHISSPTNISQSNFSCYGMPCGDDNFRHKERQKRLSKFYDTSCTPTSTSISVNRLRSCDVYIGFHGRKTLLLRFTNWLRAELEVHGMSCFVTDRSRCRNSRKHAMVERAMDACTFGVIILTRKSFQNPYTIEELRFFSGKKNLVPVYFDVGPDDCAVRDIVERRGEMWEKLGGELWLLYGGIEREWKDAVNALSRVESVDEWKLDAHNGKWRDCIIRAVTLLALRLGRRCVVDRLSKWKEKVEKEEFPFPRNENFIGRKKEISELEFMLFGDISGEGERDFLELKSRNKRKNVTISWSRSSSIDERREEKKSERGRKKGKEPIVWKQSEKEIELQNPKIPNTGCEGKKVKSIGKRGKRGKSTKVEYGKGVACVSGDSGIGKTELLLEFAYRFHQRYKMILWIGGESRYIRQNYLDLWTFLEVDVGVENGFEKSRTKSFEEQEESAITRVRRELMRNIPFLVIIDNLESEKDWWDRKPIMDLLPRFGGETHILISTRLPRVMNFEPLKLSYLSEAEAMSLMLGSTRDYPLQEIDALRTIEEKLGRLTLGMSMVGAILSELPINPSRLLDTINRMPMRDLLGSGRESHLLRRNVFLLQLFEVCFSIFDHADGPSSLATRMVYTGGWFGPGSIPIPLLALAAHKVPEKRHRTRLWKKVLSSLACGFSSSYLKKSEIEASSMLLRFNIARACTQENYIRFNDIIKLYVQNRAIKGVAQATVQAIMSRGFTPNHAEHIWASCFLLLGFGNDPIIVELKVSDMIFLVKEVILPLAITVFITFSRCSAALELLRLSTDALEAADHVFVTPVEKWLDKSLCWKPVQTNAQLNPCLWQELALTRATVLETRAKLMMRGGLFDIGDDLIRKAIFIRTSICGEDHPETVAARETLSKITRLLANVQARTSP